MIDLSATIKSKSDQLNADDLIGAATTITITKVSQVVGEQPIAINYEGDNGKPWKPCLSMRRVLVGAWGKDGAQYTGRSLTLYRDDKVVYAGEEVGGIRISHMSHIQKEMTFVLKANKKSRKKITILPLIVDVSKGTKEPAKDWTSWGKDFVKKINDAKILQELEEIQSSESESLAKIKEEAPRVFERININIARRIDELTPQVDANIDTSGDLSFLGEPE